MNRLLYLILLLSLAGSLLAGLVYLLRPLLRHRLAKSWQYYIWLIVVVRLLCPWGLPPMANTSAPLEPEPVLSQNQNPATGSAAAEPEHPFLAARETARALQQPLPLRHKAISGLFYFLGLAWLVVALALLCASATRYLRFLHHLAVHGSPAPPALTAACRRAGTQLGLKRLPKAVCCREVTVPMQTGLLHPRLVLPSSCLFMADEPLQFILLHELSHYKRRDILYKWLLQLAVCLHWFNPLVHRVQRDISLACELACDELVLGRLPPRCHKAYGSLLLDWAEASKGSPFAPMGATLTASAHSLKTRLMGIRSYGAASSRGKPAACLLAALLTLCALAASPRQFNPPPALSATSTQLLAGDMAAYTADYRPLVLEAWQVNNHTVGWLSVPGTGISDPVVQAPDTSNGASPYLSVDFFGEVSEEGAYFADYRSTFGNRREALSTNTTLYGRSFSDDPGSGLFSSLKHYRDPDFAQAHPYLVFSTGEENMVWEVFAVFDAHVDFAYILPYNGPEQEEAFAQVLEGVKALSLHSYDVDVGPGDKVLTLSTATYLVNGAENTAGDTSFDYRFSVMAKLVPQGQALQKTASLTPNPAPLPPDAFAQP